MLFKTITLAFSALLASVSTAGTWQVPDIAINAFGVKVGVEYKDYRYINYPFKTKINITPEHPLPELLNHYQIVLNRDSTVHSVYAYGDVYKDWAACDIDARKLFLKYQEQYKGFVRGTMDINRYYLLSGNTQDMIIKCNEKDRLYFIAKIKQDMVPDPPNKL